MTIENLYLQAQLASASYANLNTTLTLNEQAQALTRNGVGLAPLQVLSLHFSGWSVKAVFADSTSGANATVFQNAQGATYLAVAGTNPATGADLWADVQLAVGVPANSNSQYQSLKSQVTSWLADGMLNANFTVAGHSLGGYLAAALKTDFGENITEVYMFNAPSVGGIFGSIGEFFSKSFGLPTPSTAGVYNIQSSEGPSATAGLGYDLSPAILVQMDIGTSAISGHDMFRLTDGLAVQAKLAELFGEQGVPVFNAMMDAAGLNVGLSPEGAIDALRRLAYGPSYAKVGDTREALYQALADPGLAVLANAQCTNLVGCPVETIVTLAQQSDSTGEAVRRALTVRQVSL